jgi:aldehyde dehydrogenase (NAD+)
MLLSLSFGGGAVNETNIHVFIESMPFGGVGNSGIGIYYGSRYRMSCYSYAPLHSR